MTMLSISDDYWVTLCCIVLTVLWKLNPRSWCNAQSCTKALAYQPVLNFCNVMCPHCVRWCWIVLTTPGASWNLSKMQALANATPRSCRDKSFRAAESASACRLLGTDSLVPNCVVGVGKRLRMRCNGDILLADVAYSMRWAEESHTVMKSCKVQLACRRQWQVLLCKQDVPPFTIDSIQRHWELQLHKESVLPLTNGNRPICIDSCNF